MPIDTSDFDNKIKDIQTQVDSLQSEFDIDDLNVRLKSLQEKRDNVSVLINKIASIQSDKARYIVIQEEILQLKSGIN